jgi:CheY-like chemotaxis protein/Ran GTPase-activating protein (RanGAP) involved in mRNA processing and transport
MMQAAQLAAEAAMREAADDGGGGGATPPNLSMIEMMGYESSSSNMSDSSEMMGQMEYMQGLQHEEDYPGDSRYQQEQQYYQDEQYYHEHEQQQHGGGGEDYNQMLFREMQMMGIDPNDPEGVQFFLQLVHQREEQERQQADRPDEHYMTIAQNGMILEATKTITGFPPDSLLMTSAYDTVYEDDLPGLLAVKTHFWDNGNPDVEAYVRRRSQEGEWIWLCAKAVSYVEQPIPGIILIERRVISEGRESDKTYYDEEEDGDYDSYVNDMEALYRAKSVNAITRISAILIQAVEAAQEAAMAPELSSGARSGQRNRNGSNLHDDQQSEAGSSVDSANKIPWVAEDAAAYQAMLLQQQKHGTEADISNDPLRQIMKVAKAGGTSSRSQNQAAVKLEQEIMERVAGATKRDTFDPFSVLEDVRAGSRLDFGMNRLGRVEIRLMMMILLGELTVNELIELVFRALSCRVELDTMIDHVLMERRQNHPAGLSVRNNVLPCISVVNLSYSYLGNFSIDLFCEVIGTDQSPLRTIDVSFCGLEDRGITALSKALVSRKMKGIAPLRGIILSGNYISLKVASELGLALSPDQNNPFQNDQTNGGDSDMIGNAKSDEGNKKYKSENLGLQVLHLGLALKDSKALRKLLYGLGPSCPVKELSLASNSIGPEGVEDIVEFLEGRNRPKKAKHVMPYLGRLDFSNNNIGNEGLRRLTRILQRRGAKHLVELRLSNNGIAHSGVEEMMMKLLQHNLVSLTLDKNGIGDQGCQLIAASLLSMKCLSRLNLSFNQIGSRGVNSLMRSLVACESVTYLGLSGNIMKISGAVALAFTLAQHPRLEELDVDNCCLSQAAQCHIIAGIISNRFVPMKRMNGFEAGPPMVALGALQISHQGVSNEECFRIRKDEQMKTILKWMESNRAKLGRRDPNLPAKADTNSQYLTPDSVQSMNDIEGIPSQNAYLRLLSWLSRIPFDEDELISLRKYFYDSDGLSDDRGSDGYVNLKLRGDLLAALESDVADEIRDETPMLVQYDGSVGFDIDRIFKPKVGVVEDNPDPEWDYMTGRKLDKAARLMASNSNIAKGLHDVKNHFVDDANLSSDDDMVVNRKRGIPASAEFSDTNYRGYPPSPTSTNSTGNLQSLQSTSMVNSDSEPSNLDMSQGEREIRRVFLKARITMFPQFEDKLEELKRTATEMIESEEDPEQQEIILTQYAEASLTILRQLRYHCMNNGLDGWRQGSMKRKVLIVDDSNVTRKLLSRAFERADFIVDSAENGAEGVEKLKHAIYDIAFMDIDMPVMNGFEATKRLREWEDDMRPGVRQPICALTAAHVDDFERSELMRFKEAGLDVFESKPCNIPRLFKVVDDVSPMFSDLLSISATQKRNQA